MNISVIPWHVFLDALLKQQPQTLEGWLRRWLFTNEGVIMAHPNVGPKNYAVAYPDLQPFARQS
ncbi:MAG TPA: hypothetical protein VEI95_03720 [Acidobacteriota bacterium]|nr:hypothetical protein [Acidobacteriota bacterium]